MIYNILPAALGPVGWALLGGAAAGAILVKAFGDDCDRSVTVVQNPPNNAKRRKRKRTKKRTASA